MDEQKELTVPEAAQYMGVKELTIRRYIKAGRLPSRKVSKGLQHYYLIAIKDLEALKNQQKE